MFKDRLKEIRKQRNLTQAQLAEIVGVSATSVYLWERGTVKPGYGTLVLISEKLEVDIKQLL